jgi:autotransporter-associated beta strand protein
MTTSPSAAVPTGWGFFRTGTSAVPLTPSFTSGSTSTVVMQNAGSAGSAPTSAGAYLWVTGTLASGTDKAIGFLTAGSYPGPGASSANGNGVAILFGFSNTTGSTITDLSLAWDYEKYRSGTRAQGWNFYTSTDGSNWSANSAGDLSYPSDANSTTMSNPPLTSSTGVTLSGLNIANNASYYLRWSLTTTGSWSNAQGLAIDNFSLTATYPLVALDLYWDGGSGWSGTAPGSGGAGTWDDGSGAWDSAKSANFDGTAGSVTAGTVTAGRGLTFSTTGYTLSGGTITLSGTPSSLNTISAGTNSAMTTTISSVLAGTNGLIKAGAGTLVLGGANTFTGNMAVNAGTLQVAADTSFGDAANDISLAASTLKTTAGVAMAAGRDMTGSGTLDIAPGTTLTSSGSFNLSATTLSNSGTLSLQGATRSVGTLTFGTAAAVTGSGAISATGLTATAVTSGTAVINSAITFSSGDKTVDIGTGGTLLLAGDLAGTTGRILKTGAGTLIVSGSNSTSGFRIGASAASPTNGGTVILGSAASSGTNQLQFNYGTLQTATAAVFPVGLSIGGRSGAVAVLGAANDMTFSGSTSFFRGTSTSGEMRLDVNNTTAIDGVFGATSGGGSATGVTLGGTGRLVLNGNASLLTDTITLQDTLDLVVNNALGGGVNVANGTLLGGTGTIAGPVSVLGGGLLSPGTSPGTLTINNTLTLADTTVVAFELNATDQTVGGGINDLIAGVANLTLDGVLNVTGIGDFTTLVAPLTWRLFNYSGTLTDNTLTLGSTPSLGAGQTFAIDTSTAGQVNLSIVPEPSTIAMATVGIAAVALGLARRSRR